MPVAAIPEVLGAGGAEAGAAGAEGGGGGFLSKFGMQALSPHGSGGNHGQQNPQAKPDPAMASKTASVRFASVLQPGQFH